MIVCPIMKEENVVAVIPVVKHPVPLGTSLNACFCKRGNCIVCRESSNAPVGEVTEGSEPREYTLKELIQEAVDQLPEGDKANALSMTLRDILKDTDTEGRFNLPKSILLMEAHRVICPMCGTPGRIRLQEGRLVCSACMHDWGDIDDLPDMI